MVIVATCEHGLIHRFVASWSREKRRVKPDLPLDRLALGYLGADNWRARCYTCIPLWAPVYSPVGHLGFQIPSVGGSKQSRRLITPAAAC